MNDTKSRTRSAARCSKRSQTTLLHQTVLSLTYRMMLGAYFSRRTMIFLSSTPPILHGFSTPSLTVPPVIWWCRKRRLDSVDKKWVSRLDFCGGGGGGGFLQGGGGGGVLGSVFSQLSIRKSAVFDRLTHSACKKLPVCWECCTSPPSSLWQLHRRHQRALVIVC